MSCDPGVLAEIAGGGQSQLAFGYSLEHLQVATRHQRFGQSVDMWNLRAIDLFDAGQQAAS
ncbi:MAG: hypothetical protein AAGA12_03375 [Pseudomonadota bacterium]